MSGDSDSSTGFPQDQNSDDWLKSAESWWSGALSEAGAGFRKRLDAEARSRHRSAPPWAEDRISPDLFNQHVTPDLEAVIRGYACFIRREMAEYGEALDAALAYAWRRGAWGFSSVHLADLQDWIADTLRSAIGEW